MSAKGEPIHRQEMSNWKLSVGVLAVLMLAVLVWTTRFKYGEMHFGSQIVDVRTNRFTDETERLTMAVWKVMAPAHARGEDREALQTLAKAFARMDEQHKKLLLSMAAGM